MRFVPPPAPPPPPPLLLLLLLLLVLLRGAVPKFVGIVEQSRVGRAAVVVVVLRFAHLHIASLLVHLYRVGGGGGRRRVIGILPLDLERAVEAVRRVVEIIRGAVGVVSRAVGVVRKAVGAVRRAVETIRRAVKAMTEISRHVLHPDFVVVRRPALR